MEYLAAKSTKKDQKRKIKAQEAVFRIRIQMMRIRIHGSAFRNCGSGSRLIIFHNNLPKKQLRFPLSNNFSVQLAADLLPSNPQKNEMKTFEMVVMKL